VINLIAGTIPYTTAVMGAHRYVTDDTVEYRLTITFPPGPVNFGVRLQPVWNLLVHHHPRPVTPNWLHIKKAVGADPGNVVPQTHGLINLALLRAGATAWEGRTSETATRPT
jgi:hypothetical protein